MAPMKRFFRLGVGKDHVERAVNEELEFHIETRVQRLIAQGMTPEAARAEAMKQFGDIERVRVDCVTMDHARERAVNRSDFVDQVSQDVRYALRALRKARGMTTVAVVTLAVAIALLTTVFSVLNAGLFRPLPYPDANRLVAVNAFLDRRGGMFNEAPFEIANAIRHDTKSFERVALYDGWNFMKVTDNVGSETFNATPVDTALLSLLGARAQRGRLFTDAEIVSNAPVALISDSLWRARYGADETIIGREITLERQSRESRTVVGVLSRGFGFSGHTDIWVPLVERVDTAPPKKAGWYWVIAKLKPEVSAAQARLEVEQIGRNFVAAKPADYNTLRLMLMDTIVRRNNPAYLTMAGLFVLIAFCVFLIACSNVGNLLLVRAAERRAEMAIRASLGATKQRLFRQSLTESALIALAAGIAGTALSVALLKVLLAIFPTQHFPTWLQFGVDIRVLGFVLFVVSVAVMAFGFAPARHGTAVRLADAMKTASDVMVVDSGVARSSRRSVVVQIALSLSLFVASLFFARSYLFLARLDHGYDTAHVAYTQLRLEEKRYPDFTAQIAAYDRVRAQMNADVRIEETALVGELSQIRRAPGSTGPRPASDSVTTSTSVWLPGHDAASSGLSWPFGQRLAVSDEYFHMMRMSVVRGRSFGPQDVAGGQLVAIVSQRLARILWGKADPIGKIVQAGKIGPSFIVVGVASDVRDAMMSLQGTSAEALPNIYFAAMQIEFYPRIYFRPRGAMETATPAIAAAMREVDPAAPCCTVIPAGQSGEALWLARIFGLAVGSMAVCGTLLAMLGIYGVIAYSVTRRTREIGLRVALGARPEQVVALFTREAVRFTATGLAIGVAMAAALSLVTRIFVFGSSLLDPGPYLMGALVFGAVSLLACWLAARRASRVEPLDALRSL